MIQRQSHQTTTCCSMLIILLFIIVRLSYAVPPPIITLTDRITDFTGQLPAETLRYLSSTIEAQEKVGGPRVIVVLIAISAPEAIDAYAERLLAAQPPKPRLDALLVLEPAAKTGRIAVSPAARSMLSPVAARIILRENVFVYLREGDIIPAVEHGVGHILEALQGVTVDSIPASRETQSSLQQAKVGLIDIPQYAPVCDLTGTLAAQDISALISDIESLRSRKGAQMTVLMLPTTKPETIEQFALRVFEQWKPGRKGIDDGVLIVVAKDDRRARIEVGYGLEGVITDLIAGRIISEQVMPRFKKNDFAGGIMSGLEKISRVIEGEQLPPLKVFDSGMPTTTDLIISSVVVLLAIVASFWIPPYLAALLASVCIGIILWITNGPGVAIFLGCFSGAITFMLPDAILGRGRSSSGSGAGGGSSGGSDSGGGGGSSGGGGASGGW